MAPGRDKGGLCKQPSPRASPKRPDPILPFLDKEEADVVGQTILEKLSALEEISGLNSPVQDSGVGGIGKEH